MRNQATRVDVALEEKVKLTQDVLRQLEIELLRVRFVNAVKYTKMEIGSLGIILYRIYLFLVLEGTSKYRKPYRRTPGLNERIKQRHEIGSNETG